jgi:hypothetical protein
LTKNRLVAFLSALGVAVGATLAVGAPAQAATPAVQITKVYYNSPGTDDRSNSSLNAEWVRMTNRTTRAINLKYWTLRDKAGHIYRFSSDYRLDPGKHVYVHTGKGTNGKPDYQHRYWNSSAYIWNNTGDAAYLRNPSGSLIDSCSWGSSGSYTYC